MTSVQLLLLPHSYIHSVYQNMALGIILLQYGPNAPSDLPSPRRDIASSVLVAARMHISFHINPDFLFLYCD